MARLRKRQPLSNFYAFEEMLFNWLGITKRKPNVSKPLHFIRSLWPHLGLLGMGLPLVINLYFHPEDIDKFSYCIPFTFEGIACTANFQLNGDLFEEITLITKDPLMADYALKYDPMVHRRIKLMQRFSKLYMSSLMYFCLFLFVYPLAVANPNKPLLMPGYWVLDPKEHQFLVLSMQFGCMVTACFMMVANTTFFASLAILLATQLHILNENLREVAEVRDVEKELKKCVKHHQIILKFAQLMNRLQPFGLLVGLILRATTICLLIYQLLFSTSGEAFYTSLLATAIIQNMTSIFFYCWSGQQVMDKGREISESCFYSEWTDCHPTLKTYFILIMERTKLPLTLNVYNIFVFSMPTFKSICTNSWTYFTVLRTLLKKN